MRIENHTEEKEFWPIIKFRYDTILYAGTVVGFQLYKGSPGQYKHNKFYHIPMVRKNEPWFAEPTENEKEELRKQYPGEVLQF